MPRPKTKPRAAEKDALTLLKDHDTVRELLSELEEAEGRKRLATLRNIEQELKVHTKIEEDIFYPAFREASEKEEDTELYFEALVETSRRGGREADVSKTPEAHGKKSNFSSSGGS